LPGTQGHADANFVCSVTDGVGHHAIDANRRNDDHRESFSNLPKRTL